MLGLLRTKCWGCSEPGAGVVQKWFGVEHLKREFTFALLDSQHLVQIHIFSASSDISEAQKSHIAADIDWPRAVFEQIREKIGVLVNISRIKVWSRDLVGLTHVVRVGGLPVQHHLALFQVES